MSQTEEQELAQRLSPRTRSRTVFTGDVITQPSFQAPLPSAFQLRPRRTQSDRAFSAQSGRSVEERDPDITHVGFVRRDGIEDQSHIFTSSAAQSDQSFAETEASTAELRAREEFQTGGPFLTTSEQFQSEAPGQFEEPV